MTGGEKRSGSPSTEQESGNGHSKILDAKKAKLESDSSHAVEKANGNSENTEKHHHKDVEHPPVEHKNGGGDGDKAAHAEKEANTEATHGLDEKTAQQRVEKIYGLKMPKDFVDFWDFCCQVNPMNPRMALSEIFMEVCGPFDFLAGDITVEASTLEETKKKALTHWRFYYDTPEVQTVLHSLSENSQLHYGYYRESPTDLPIFVVGNDTAKGCKLEEMGTNLFAVIYKITQDRRKDAKEGEQAALTEFAGVIKTHADKFGHSIGTHVHTRIRGPKVADAPNGIALLSGKHHETSLEKKHHLSHPGMDHILADYDDADKEHHDEADKKLKDFEEQLEADRKEGNFGTTLELGLALFCKGSQHLDKRASGLLSTAYKALNKAKFAEIAEAHLAHRVQASQLSKFDSAPL